MNLRLGPLTVTTAAAVGLWMSRRRMRRRRASGEAVPQPGPAGMGERNAIERAAETGSRSLRASELPAGVAGFAAGKTDVTAAESESRPMPPTERAGLWSGGSPPTDEARTPESRSPQLRASGRPTGSFGSGARNANIPAAESQGPPMKPMERRGPRSADSPPLRPTRRRGSSSAGSPPLDDARATESQPADADGWSRPPAR
jgi:hypothetical protein